MFNYHMLSPFLATLLVIALAELGDKTQLLSIGFATRYKLRTVVGGVVLATAILMALAVGLGKAVVSIIPSFFLQLLVGILFIAFGLWIIFSSEEEKEEKTSSFSNPFLTVFVGFFLAELGDKTQLATIVLTAKYNSPFQVWLGAVLGMALVNLLGILIGNRLQAYLPYRVVKIVAAAVFFVFGLITLITVVLQKT